MSLVSNLANARSKMKEMIPATVYEAAEIGEN